LNEVELGFLQRFIFAHAFERYSFNFSEIA
jgi:hypothetical protein